MYILNAVGIEHTLARFFGYQIGTRGMFFDADVFRGGDPKDLAEVMSRVADTLEMRIAGIKFASEGNGSSKAQVKGCISRLRALSDLIQQHREREHEDYHWEIFGALMSAIVGLLETLEAQGSVH